MKTKHVSAFPYLYIIDPTNICNLKCPLCLTGAGLGRQRKGTANLQTFKNFVDQIADYAIHVFLYNWGEPLLVRNIHEFIEYVKVKGITASISTNLSFPIGRDRAEGLITSGLDRLVVSCDGCDQASYETYRRGGQFSTVLKNISLLLDIRKSLKRKRPYIEWQFLLTGRNEGYTVQAKKVAENIGVDFFSIGTALLPFGYRADQYPEWIASHRRSSPFPDIADSDLCNPCWWLWRAAVINWDGTVSPCCYTDDERGIFGNIEKDQFLTIWNNHRFKNARGLFSKTRDGTFPCSSCSVFKRTLKSKAH